MFEQLVAVAAPYGPVGLLCAYFVWREWRRDEADAKRNERIESIMLDRAEADKEMAIAMTRLAERIK